MVDEARCSEHTGARNYFGQRAHRRSGWFTRAATRPASAPVPAK
jgi:hypothetical protein